MHAADPHLHILRSVIRAIDDHHARQEAESARFHLFASLEADNHVAAREWLTALRVALATYCAAYPDTPAGYQRVPAMDALDAIERMLMLSWASIETVPVWSA